VDGERYFEGNTVVSIVMCFESCRGSEIFGGGDKYVVRVEIKCQLDSSDLLHLVGILFFKCSVLDA
jgi:hypothetical protein